MGFMRAGGMFFTLKSSTFGANGPAVIFIVLLVVLHGLLHAVAHLL